MKKTNIIENNVKIPLVCIGTYLKKNKYFTGCRYCRTENGKNSSQNGSYKLQTHNFEEK